MAFFGVTREKIGQIKTHPQADRLEIGKLEGVNFQFVIPKGQYSVGESVLYFPLDAVLPEKTAKAIGLFEKLSGPNKDRIRTVKLRGAISQGIIAPTSILSNPEETNTELITQELGVTKYEPAPVPCHSGNLIQLPVGLSAYDIEGAERNMTILEKLMDKHVVITEKMEGQNFAITWSGSEQKFYVNQRNYSIEPIEGKEHDFWRIARVKGYFQLMEKFKSIYGDDKNITLYGEYLGPGIQGNIYKLKECEVKFFDLKINNDYVDAVTFLTLIDSDFRVPTLFSLGSLREFLTDKDIVTASHGKSLLNPETLREGIVVKPEREERVDGFGRLILKQRDAIYLANEK